jgi:hypothetical protein
MSIYFSEEENKLKKTISSILLIKEKDEMKIELNQLFISFPSLGKIYEAASKNKGSLPETMKQFKGELTPFLILVMERFCNLFDNSDKSTR